MKTLEIFQIFRIGRLYQTPVELYLVPGTGTRMTYSSSNLLLLVLQSSSREYDCTVLYLQSPHTKGFVQSNLSVVHLRSMTLYPCALAQIFESCSSQNVRGLSTCEKDEKSILLRGLHRVTCLLLSNGPMWRNCRTIDKVYNGGKSQQKCRTRNKFRDR